MKQLLQFKQRVPLLNKWVNPISRKAVVLLSHKLPRTYLMLCSLYALCGYLFLLAFPYLVLRLPFVMLDSWQHAASAPDYGYLALQAALFLLSIVICVALFKLQFALPPGLEISRDKFPRLFELLDEVASSYATSANRFERVILRENFEIKFIKTPRRLFPVFNRNTLVIGLPVLQAMKPVYFRALLARKIGQASLKHNPVTGWLTSLNEIWPQYARAGKKAGAIALPLTLFFKIYAKFYNVFLLGVFRFDELKADQYALDIINDHDLMEVITLEVVSRDFINNKYWPKINQMARRNGKPEILPHANMVKVIRAGMKKEDFIASIEAAWHREDDYKTPHPHFIERIKNLGHHKPLAPSPHGDTAAQLYLGNNLTTIIDKFDKNWLSRFQHQQKVRHNK